MELFFLFLAQILSLAAFYFYFRKKIQDALSSRNIMGELMEDVSLLIKELNNTTDRSVTLLEDRIKAADETMKELDRRLGLLKREMQKDRKGTQLYNDIVKKVPFSAREAGAQEKDPVPVLPVAEMTASTGNPGGLGSKTPAPSGHSGEAPEPGPRERVVILFRQGEEPRAIAQQTGLTLTEVEMILSLHGGRQG